MPWQLVLMLAGCGAASVNVSTLSDGAADDLTRDASDLGPSADPSAPCRPSDCRSLLADCGDPDDGCGGSLHCGICPAPLTCGGEREGQCGVRVGAATPLWQTSKPFDGSAPNQHVRVLAFRPDGGRLAASGGVTDWQGFTDTRFVTFDVQSGVAGPVYPYNPLDGGGATCLAWSSDGQRLAFGNALGSGAAILPVDAGGAFGAPQNLHLLIWTANSIAWLPDGSLAVSNLDGVFHFDDATTDPARISSLRLWPLFVIGSALVGYSWEVVMFSLATLTEQGSSSTTRPPQPGDPQADPPPVAADVARRRLVIGTDRQLLIYSLDAWQDINFEWPVSSPIVALDYEPSRRKIATAHQDGNLRIWDADAQTLDISQPTGQSVTALSWSPDGKRVVTAGNSLIVWTVN
jgi:WD40 repeat protein